jgi:plasmid stabilization system protein ParE
MALKIKWSVKAKFNYDNVLSYLDENWSKKEVENFIKKTESILNIISHQPYIFKAASHKKVRKAILGKQNSLFYLVLDSEVYLLSFWDNRMDPKKNKY